MNTFIGVNDIFDELNEENKRLLDELIVAKNCLKIVNEFKTFIDLNLNNFKLILDSNTSLRFEQFCREVDRSLNQRPVISSIFSNSRSEVSAKEVPNTQIGETQADIGLLDRLKTLEPIGITDGMVQNKDKGTPKQRTSGKPKRFRPINTFSYSDYWKEDLKKYVCDVDGCSYQTEVRRYLKYHFVKHENKKAVECQFCGKQFSTKKYMIIHIKNTHDIAEQPLVCDIDNCNKMFKNQFRLNTHQRDQHFKDKQFVCDFPNCQFKTSIEYYLKEHKNRHSNERRFQCDVEGCGKAFKVKKSLNDHMKTHLNVERNYKCIANGCNKTFKDAQGLRIHIRHCHSGIKYKCDWPGCDFQSNFPGSVRTHKSVHSTERNFLCVWPQCGRSFKTKDNLKEHWRNHTNEKRYACSWPGCHYRTVYAGNLSKHMRSHRS